VPIPNSQMAALNSSIRLPARPGLKQQQQQHGPLSSSRTLVRAHALPELKKVRRCCLLATSLAHTSSAQLPACAAIAPIAATMDEHLPALPAPTRQAAGVSAAAFFSALALAGLDATLLPQQQAWAAEEVRARARESGAAVSQLVCVQCVVVGACACPASQPPQGALAVCMRLCTRARSIHCVDPHWDEEIVSARTEVHTPGVQHTQCMHAYTKTRTH